MAILIDYFAEKINELFKFLTNKLFFEINALQQLGESLIFAPS